MELEKKEWSTPEVKELVFKNTESGVGGDIAETVFYPTNS